MKRLLVATLMMVFAVCAVVVLRELGVIHLGDRANQAAADSVPSPQVVAAKANMLLQEWSYPGAWDDPDNPAARQTEKQSPRPGLVWTRCLATRDKPGKVWQYYLKEFGFKRERGTDPAHAKSLAGGMTRSIPSGTVDVDYSFQPGQKFTQIVVKVTPPPNLAGPYLPALFSGLHPAAPPRT